MQISIQRCDTDGDNRLRVCHSACESYNTACGARLDCSDRTLFSGKEGDGEGVCTGDGAVRTWWQMHATTALLLAAIFLLMLLTTLSLLSKLWRYQTLPLTLPLPASRPPPPRAHGDLWWITMGDALRDDMRGHYVVLAPDGADFQSPPPSPPSISVDSAKVTRSPSRGLIHEILLDRTGQLSSRGSPRKGDYTLMDSDS